MPSPDLLRITAFVEAHIGEFHAKRLASLGELKLEKVLKRKNPYLFRAKNLSTPETLVRALLDAHLSSQEETIFGELLEKLAIHVCGLSCGGWKSGIAGIDLELDRDGHRYIVSIKSGPHWGNSEQIKKLRSSFKLAAVALRTSGSKLHIRAINGCCYGRDNQPDKGDYDKLCGQRFWEFISGNADFYMDLIEPLGHQAKKRNDAFAEKYDQVLTLFSQEFASGYCVNGKIDWNKIVVLGSSAAAPKANKPAKVTKGTKAKKAKTGEE